jgi:ABC-type multidrug transport system fused ATPase/permease subunit
MFGEHDDAVLNSALRAAGLFALQDATISASDDTQDAENGDKQTRLTLDSAIASGGTNLSVGQRQIIALARAMVRQSKLLILDEATSAIGKKCTLSKSGQIPSPVMRVLDYETDALIQASLRRELSKDVTVLTVAHRLQTIMDSDKIVSLYLGSLSTGLS